MYMSSYVNNAMRKLIISFLFVAAFVGNVFSQTVRFTYDASGNRTQRFIEVKEVKQVPSLLNENQILLSFTNLF
jgi:hypothetical protein